jgi:hypothetical protein
LSQINPIHTIPSYLHKIHFNIAFKKGQAAKSVEERRSTNYNILAHPGGYVTAATANAAVSPTKHFNI